MRHCSNSDGEFGHAPAATIDDLLDLVSAATPEFAECLNATEILQSLEPSLVFLVSQAGQVFLLHDCGNGDGRALAEDVARGLPDRYPERLHQFRVDSTTGPLIGLVVSLPFPPADIALVCLIRASLLPPELIDCPEDHTSILLGSLAWIAARNKIETVQTHARAEQLAAGQEALEESYARNLAKAVEEREERLREQEEHASRLRAVMMTAADGIITVDGKGLIETFNAAATDMFGYTPNEVIDCDVSMLFPHAEDSSANVLAECLSRGAGNGRYASVHELLGRRKDGTIFPLEMAVSDLAIEDRIIITAILRDVTERKEAERELRHLHLFNRMILDSAGEGIVGLDLNGMVAFVNPIAEQLLGRRSVELVGESLHELTHHSRPSGVHYDFHECPVHKTLGDGTIHREYGEVFWRADGTSFPVEYVATPMREDGKIIGAVLTFQDITHRKALESQLVQAQKLESIGQLAAGIAHEINTPTQFIGDNLRFLSDAFTELQPLWDACMSEHVACDASTRIPLECAVEGADFADIRYLVNEVPMAISQSLEGVERVAKIVRSMKEFSHPGNEEKQAIDLNRAIESTLTVCRNEWKYVADVVTDFDPELPAVTCLPGECNQVLLNLIINASHAIADVPGDNASQKGTITVSTRKLNDSVEIRVADTGTGIPKEVRSRVFDPFFTTKEVGRGTGQGLAIARSVVVEKHGGSLTFETEMGRGTTFIIRLPTLSP